MSQDDAAVLAAYMTEDARNRTPHLRPEITRWLRDCVAKHQGSVVNLTSEGWFLATFEVALRAVSCAVEIQRRSTLQDAGAEIMESQRLHIGLNFEVPPIDGSTWPPEMDDKVDRLVALVEPGGICFSRTIYYDIKFRIDLPFDTTRDPKHTAFMCQEIRQKLNVLNLLEAGAVRIGAAALAEHFGVIETSDTASTYGAGPVGKIWAFVDRILLSFK